MKSPFPYMKAFASVLYRKPPARRLAYLIVLILFAFSDFAFSGMARKTFLYPSSGSGDPRLEVRFLPFRGDRESLVERYAQEALLGPAGLDSEYLFAPGTRLETVMIRDGVAYIGISEDGAIPFPPNRSVGRGLSYFRESILRNFYFIKDVRIFIGGESPLAEKTASAAQDTHEKK